MFELQSGGKLTDSYRILSVETDKMFAFMIYFDRDRKLAICSFGVHDSKNQVTGGIKTERTKRFYKYPCPELKNDRISSDSYTKCGYDRGHLSPSDADRYSVKA